MHEVRAGQRAVDVEVARRHRYRISSGPRRVKRLETRRALRGDTKRRSDTLIELDRIGVAPPVHGVDPTISNVSEVSPSPRPVWFVPPHRGCAREAADRGEAH